MWVQYRFRASGYGQVFRVFGAPTLTRFAILGVRTEGFKAFRIFWGGWPG